MSNIQELVPFNKVCDEFMSGKYILVDIKITSILNIIESDEKIKNIVSSCTENFDFNSTFKNQIAKVNDTFTISVPADEKCTIAFVYNLLYRFKGGEIDFYDFLATYYDENDDSKGVKSFAHDMILPFKNAINNIYSKRHILVETNDYQNNIYNKIKTTIKLIVQNIDNYKLKMNEKEEFTMLLNSLFLASEKNDKKLVYSLMIGLDYFTKCNKKCRVAYLALEECFEKN
ncbi:MAG: hypothetical protein E7351_02685 [Clostridiales bacterium]|nr:hypothetical protein [Clostridiales bacterium]